MEGSRVDDDTVLGNMGNIYYVDHISHLLHQVVHTNQNQLLFYIQILDDLHPNLHILAAQNEHNSQKYHLYQLPLYFIPFLGSWFFRTILLLISH